MRPRNLSEPPPAFPPLPGWTRQAAAETLDDAASLAGAALAVLSPIARHPHPLGRLWRRRLALADAAVLVRQSGRTEDEAALRDAWHLRREGDDPGPAGRVLKAWRALSEPAAPADLPALFELRADEALDEVLAAATKLAAGQGSPVAAAAEIVATTLRAVPHGEQLALWLADRVLAERLKWPKAVPLIAGRVSRADLRAAKSGGDVWPRACALAYARAATAAADLHAELARRAERLLAVAPKLRGRDADAMVAALLSEDAQAAAAGQTASDRSARRLFERLVALGVVRELTGRPTFRLYGL
jgi:hypothetical protein